MSDRKSLLIGLSGCSSSGKTTLARLLRDIWPDALILHEDDFYWPDDQIPTRNGIQDWDCLESIDVAELHSCLTYIKANASIPPQFESKEDQNSIGSVDVDQVVIQYWRNRAAELVDGSQLTIALVDGFLLYAESLKQIRDLFDIKLFLRTNYETAKRRREARSGYVTIKGFWEDPPGYVDNIVWPNYSRDHAFLFENGDVEGPFDADSCRRAGVKPMPSSAEGSMTACVQWACSAIEAAVQRITRKGGESVDATVNT